MQIGTLDRRITIEQRSVTRDSTGAEVESWTVFDTVWARFVPRPGREFFAADQVIAEARAVFVIRWRSDVTPRMRVRYDGAIYDILAVRELGRRDGLELQTKAEV